MGRPRWWRRRRPTFPRTGFLPPACYAHVLLVSLSVARHRTHVSVAAEYGGGGGGGGIARDFPRNVPRAVAPCV